SQARWSEPGPTRQTTRWGFMRSADRRGRADGIRRRPTAPSRRRRPADPVRLRRVMRIGFDGLSITARPAGSGGVAKALLVAIAKSARRPTLVAALPRGSAADEAVAGLDGVEVIRAPFPVPDTPRALWFQHA